MIYQLQTSDAGRQTIQMGGVPVPVPNGAISKQDVGKFLRYRRERPKTNQVDIASKEALYVRV